MSTEEEKLPFDKGPSPTGIYYTDPATYSMMCLNMETLPIDLRPRDYVLYRGKLVSTVDPYAFQSKEEVDEHAKMVGDLFRQGVNMTEWAEKKWERVKAEAEVLKLKYGVRVELPRDEDEGVEIEVID